MGIGSGGFYLAQQEFNRVRRQMEVGLLGLAAVGVAYRLLLRPVSVLLLRNADNEPHRWRLPVPTPAKGQAPSLKTRGVLTHSTALTAPFSQKPCVAFQAAVLFDTPGDARPARWVLQESASTAFRVGTEEVPVDKALVRSAVQPVTRLHPDVNLERFLRERGLSLHDGEFWFFEAIVEPGEEVEIELYRDPDLAHIAPMRAH